VIFISFQQLTFGQKQLVLLRKEKVMHRLYPGDELVVKLKNQKRLTKSYVNNLIGDAIVTHNDTIPFHEIERLYFRHHSRMNVIGTALVFGGITLLAIDQLNNSVVQGNEVSFDGGFTRTTLGVIAVGLPMMLYKQKYKRINYKNRLLIVTAGSLFYKPDRRSFVSPYIDN
jgi:hypothetical protein